MQTWTQNYRAIVFGLLVVVALLLAGAAMLPFVPALLWAIVLSVLTRPLYNRLRHRLQRVPAFKNGRADTVASLALTLLTLVVICIPFALIAIGLVVQVENVSVQLQSKGEFSLDSILVQLDHSIRPIAANFGAPDFKLSTYVDQHRQEILAVLRAPIQTLATQAGFTVLTLVFALLTQFFILRDGHRLKAPATELLPFSAERSHQLFGRIAETIHAVFAGTVLVAAVHGLVIGITYAAVGLPNSVLLGVISGMLCIIPLLGAPVIYIPVGLLLFVQGRTTEAMIVLAVGFLIVSQIDNVIKPFLIGGRVDLHPMAIFFAILGGVVLVGPIGVMAGPMLLTVLLALQDVVRTSLQDWKERELQVHVGTVAGE